MRIIGVPTSRRTPPNVPTIGTATNVGSGLAYGTGAGGSASVTFTKSATGQTATSFTLIANPGGATFIGTSSPIVATGLTAGTSYNFTVRANGALGSSVASGVSNSVTVTTVPQAPTMGTPTVASAQAYSTGSSTVSIPFTAGATGGTAITGYTVTSSSGLTATGTASPITISEAVGTYRTYTIKAANTNGTSVASSTSSSVLPISVPITPTIGAATATSGAASVAFTQINSVTNPSFDGGNTTGFLSANTLSLNTTSGNSLTGSNSASITLANVTDTNIIYWSATTVPATGTYTASAWFLLPSGSSLAGKTVTLAYEGTPTQTIVSSIAATLTVGTWTRASVTFTTTATTLGPFVARLSVLPNTAVGQIIYSDNWAIDTSTAGGVAVTSYTVTSTPGSLTATGTASPIAISGLTNGTAYTFTVTATNKSGTSVASVASNSVTPAAAPSFPPSFSPAQVVTITGASLAAVNSTTWTVTVNGSNITSQPPTNIAVGSTNASGISYSASSATGTVTGLTGGTVYNIQFYNGATPATASFNVTAPTYVAPPSFPPSFVPSFPPSFGPSFVPSFPPSFGPSFVPYFPPSFVPPSFGYLPPSFVPSFGPTFVPPSFGGGGGCFSKGTPVLMNDGTLKLIEDLVVGDVVKTAIIPTYPNGEDSTKWYPASVWSTNTIESVTQSSTIIAGTRTQLVPMYYLINGSIKVTGEHFIFTKRGSTWSFMRIEEVISGDCFLNDLNTEVLVESIELQNIGLYVVDIDAEPNDLYYASGLLVHNMKA